MFIYGCYFIFRTSFLNQPRKHWFKNTRCHFQTGTCSLCCVNKAYLSGSRGLRMLYSSQSLKTGRRENSCTVPSVKLTKKLLHCCCFMEIKKLLRNTPIGYNLNKSKIKSSPI